MKSGDFSMSTKKQIMKRITYSLNKAIKDNNLINCIQNLNCAGRLIYDDLKKMCQNKNNKEFVKNSITREYFKKDQGNGDFDYDKSSLAKTHGYIRVFDDLRIECKETNKLKRLFRESSISKIAFLVEKALKNIIKLAKTADFKTYTNNYNTVEFNHLDFFKTVKELKAVTGKNKPENFDEANDKAQILLNFFGPKFINEDKKREDKLGMISGALVENIGGPKIDQDYYKQAMEALKKK